MSGREKILGKLRTALKAGGPDDARQGAVSERLATAPKGLIPARGQLERAARIALFCEMAEKVSATVARIDGYAALPGAVADYLRSRNLPATIRMGADDRLRQADWSKQKALELRSGPSDGHDEAGLSHAFGGVAETGTLVLRSGGDNPTTINFLPEHHIVVIDAKDVAGDLETVLADMRKMPGANGMPRTVNLITGPSRSGDVEQKIILGAHGPRALHIVVVGE